mmetsp:Transcript_62801/g.187247  ORF Transcript_62801/g.187247 Transcript_62801/m.187247 type:complete len:289 (+) Transcript_62801:689-1555(+)
MTVRRCPREQPYFARMISTTPPTPLTSPTRSPPTLLPPSSDGPLPGGGAKRDSSRFTSSGFAKMYAAPTSAENLGTGTGGSFTFSCLPLVSCSNSTSISRAFLARVCTTATGSRHPDIVPAAMTRFWSTGLITLSISSASSDSHRLLEPIKESTSSCVAGRESLPPPPCMITATLSPTPVGAVSVAWLAWMPCKRASFSLACRTRERMTPEASRQLTMVPPETTRRWSIAFMPRSSAATPSSIHRRLSEMNFSTSSEVAGVICSSLLTALVAMGRPRGAAGPPAEANA